MSDFVHRWEMEHPDKKVIIGWTTALGKKHPIFDYVEDKEHQIGAHFQTFPVYCCRECGRRIILRNTQVLNIAE